ncbi:hypothetical protein IFM89_021137 [Coptis chinensis]|uniref:RNase H type-1 domain-containing protein n=1 Tax=Coptis chinensis TaxID=261450 RepID=A0A835I414_9MAGN|nr:hypothetical protein IFM89_021137 [Coptis chinensis]
MSLLLFSCSNTQLLILKSSKLARIIAHWQKSYGQQLPSLVLHAPKALECYWLLPPPGVIKANTDGSSRGNPRLAGWGVVLRDHNELVYGARIGGMGIETCYVAECQAILAGVERAIQMGWKNIWVECDSQATVHAFQLGNVHWRFRSH